MDHYQVEYTKYELAKLSFLECLDYLHLYEKGVELFSEEPLAFERSISKAFVITYARPFTKNNAVGGHGVGSISTRWVTRLPDKQRALHQELVNEGRNSLVAHLDIEKLQPMIFLKPGNLNDHIINWCICQINRNSIDELRALVKAANQFCYQQQQRIRPNISGSIISCRP